MVDVSKLLSDKLRRSTTFINAESFAFFAQVKRNGDCSFRLTAKWESIHYPGSENTSGDSVVGTTVIGTFNYPVPPSEPTTLHGYISQLK